MKLLRVKRNSGLTTGKLIATVSTIAITAGVIGGAGVVYGPKVYDSLRQTSSKPATTSVEADREREGFVFGDLSGDAAVEKIEVTIQTGKEGADLSEKVDLHLGVGFPLRLYPLGEDSMNPAFAAFPQKSSLERGENSIKAGESATFEFLAKGEKGQDALETTPQLFNDLTIGDIQKIGFASLGSAAWVLEGYSIKVNGKVFASHDSVNVQPKTLLEKKRDELTSLLPQNEALLKEIAELEAYIATGLAADADKGELANKKADLETAAGPLNDLAGQTSGYYPWYTEEDEKLAIAKNAESPISKLDITVLAGGGERPGTRNPLYIKTGGKKFQLTSEMDPLADIDSPQEFVISMADLNVSPLYKGDLENIGVGLIGNEERFGAIPDRAKIQRLVINADGKQIYDSERKTEDRKALEAYWLVPPVHRDDQGELVVNEEKGVQTHLWITGMPAPATISEPPPNPEPNPIPTISQPVPITPGGITTPVTPDPGNTPPPTITQVTPITPSDTAIKPITPVPASNLAPSLQKTMVTGAPSGTFVPTGTFNPLTGLQQGTFVAGSGNPGFTSLRRKNNRLGPVNPIVFVNPPTASSSPTLTVADQLKIIAAVANLIKQTPPKPKAGKVTQPKANNVRFGDGVHSAEYGAPVTVNWDIQAGTPGAKSISKCRVNLFAVNMETGATLTPALASGTTGSGTARSLTVLIPDPDTASWPLAPAQIARNKIHLLYPQAQVVPMETANGADSAIANASSPGTVVPLLPNPSSYNTAGVSFSLKPGPSQIWNTGFTAPLFTVSGTARNSYRGRYQLEDGVVNPATSWLDLDFLTPDSSKSASAAYMQGTPIRTLSGFQVAPAADVANAKVHHLASRNSNASNQLSMVYEGFITYPFTTAKVRGYRLVGNLGFLSGANTSTGTPATVTMMVDIHGDGTGWPLLRQNAGDPANNPDSNPNASDPITPTSSFQSGWLRLMTNANGFSVNPTSQTTTQAFDIPIRFDLLDTAAAAGNPASLISAYQALTHTGAAAFAPFRPQGSAVGDPVNHLFQDIGVADLAAYNNAKSFSRRQIGVTFTIKISNAAPVQNALGVFGLRLVPDVYY